MQKGKYVYKAMAHYRRKLMLVIAFAAVLFGSFAVLKFPYLKTQWFGADKLDIKRFVDETEFVTVDSVIELGRKDHKSPESSLYRSNSYWQGDTYYFDIRLNSIDDTEKVFKKTITMGKQTEEVEMYRVYIADVGSVKTAVLANSFDPRPELRVKGHITKLQKPVLSAISETLSNGEALILSDYMIDLRGLEMDTESSDHVIFWILLALVIFLVSKLVSYYINPMLSPTYRQLRRYGKPQEVEAAINVQVQAAGVYKEGKSLVLEDYIITPSTFKIIITRNHIK